MMRALHPEVFKGLLLCSWEDAGFADCAVANRARAVQFLACFLKRFGLCN